MKVMCMLLSQRNHVIIYVLKVVKTKGQSMMLIFFIWIYILITILVCIAMVAYYLIVPSKNILNLCKRTLRNIETYCWMNMTISDKGFTICVRAEIFPENSRAFYCLTFLLQKRTNTLESFWNCILFLQQQNYKNRRVILKCQHLVTVKSLLEPAVLLVFEVFKRPILPRKPKQITNAAGYNEGQALITILRIFSLN